MSDLLSLPWLEAAVLVSLFGAIAVSRVRNPVRASGWGLLFASGSLACCFLAAFAYFNGSAPSGTDWDIQRIVFGDRFFRLDDLSVSLVPTVALLHVLTTVATARTKMKRFSMPWALAAESITLAVFVCNDPWILIGLLAAGTIPPIVELLNRDKSIRIYVLHMGLFVGFLVLGWWFVENGTMGEWGPGLLFAAILVRCGVFPAHCWLTDWIEHASFGRGLQFVAPLTGVYAAVRLVLPFAPDWVLQSLGIVSLFTAVYAAGLATVQQDARRFFAFLFLSHASLVVVGLELHTSICLTGALRLWSSVILSLGGLGLTLRALEARVGRLSLAQFNGLYSHSPSLAICFIVTGLASVGFPGTLGFVATEILVDGAVEASPWVGVGVVVASALNSIAIVRAYFLLFAGTRPTATIPLGITSRERLAVLTLVAILIGGGIAPQPGIVTSHNAAERILKEREERLGQNTSGSPKD